MPAAAAPGFHRFFGRGGQLQQAHPEYEFRPGQVEMAEAVAQALDERRHLLIEAGTGTGKTLAYLLPVLLSHRRVLLSTGTRNLQEQLVAKDVPLLARALGRELRVVSMKGRGNYACKHKIEQMEVQPALLDLEELDHYRRIRAWAAASEAGDQSELDFLPDNHPLWQRLNARRETCTGGKCPRFDQCFLTLLHQRAAEADLVVVNHHLFFADLMLKRQELPGVLPHYDAVVFDEAHELESTAGQYFGVGVSSHQIEDLARDAAATLRQLGLERSAGPGLSGPRAGASISGTRGEAALRPAPIDRCERLRLAAQQLFLALGAREGRAPLGNKQEFLDQRADVYDGFMQAAAHLEAGLTALDDKPEEIHNLLRRLADARAKLAYVLESEEEGVVYWIERRGRGVFLQASPIDVSERLQEMLFDATDTVILTSATLAVENQFEYIRRRLGIRHAREQVVASPFRYAEQALLYLPAHLPPPTADGYPTAAAEEIAAILTASRGRAFVLCTSLAQMRWFHQRLAGRLEFPLLLQGEAPRHVLLERFRATPGAVLFATSSFWQGVDVQGEQLSCVIIDRLPFASPGDPVVAARIHALREQGANPFAEFQVPEAVLALKQGFGRLIRSARDRGVLALLDARIRSKGYGRQFLRSLPEFRVTAEIADVQAFFGPPPAAAPSPVPPTAAPAPDPYSPPVAPAARRRATRSPAASG